MTLIHRLARAVALTALAGAASLSFAQGASAPSASSPAKKALIDKVLLLQQPAIEGLANTLIGQPAQQMLQAAGQAIQQLPAEKRELVGNEIQAEVRKFFEDTTPTVRAAAVRLAPSTYGTAMENAFSEDELKTLVAWLESPVSKKFGKLAAEGQPQLLQKLVAESRPTVEPKLKALEDSVRKKLTAAGAASAPAPGTKPAASGAKK